MATEQDIVKALTEQTESGKLEWAPTAKSRWNSEMRGCRFSLMSNAVDILDYGMRASGTGIISRQTN